MLALVWCLGAAGCQLLLPPPSSSQEPSGPQVTNLQNAQIGVRYAYTVFPHCGFRGVSLNNRPWIPTEEGDVDLNSTSTDGFEHGSLVLVDRDTAVFTSSGGVEVELRPRREGVDPEGEMCM